MKQSVLIITFNSNSKTKEKVDEFIKQVGSECIDVLFASSSIVTSLIKEMKEKL